MKMMKDKLYFFTKPNCPKCVIHKKMMDAVHLEYIYIDITQDKEAYDFIVGKGHRSVPHLYKNDKHTDIEQARGRFNSMIRNNLKGQ